MFKGSIVALVTPFTGNNEIDYKAFTNLIEFHIKNGTHAIVVNGTTGESPTISDAEYESIIATAVASSKKRIPIIVGTGTNSTSSTIEKTKKAKELGADAALIVAPYYNRPTQEGLYLHFETVANAVDIPIILYNVPTRTSSDILPDTAIRLSRIKNIIGIKEATGDLSRFKQIKQGVDDNFIILSGDDSTACDFMLQGGDGVISVTANIVPKLMSNMCINATANGLAENIEAKEINANLSSLHDLLMIEPNPIPVKWAMSELGFIGEYIRLPLTHLSQDSQGKINEAIKQLNLKG